MCGGIYTMISFAESITKIANLLEQVEDFLFLFLSLFLFLWELKVAEQLVAVQYVQEDYCIVPKHHFSLKKKSPKQTTYRRKLTTTTTTTTTQNRRQSRQILNLLGQIMRQIMILLTIQMNWSSWQSKRIIWQYFISRNRWDLWDRNIIKMKGCNLRKGRLLRNPTLLRAIHVTIVTIVLSRSGTGTLRGVRRCFGPIQIN